MDSNLIEITQNEINTSQNISNAIADDKIRARACANILAINTAKKYLDNRNIQPENVTSACEIKHVLESIDIADVYIGDLRLDVRLVFQENQIFIPKSHSQLGIEPDYYMVILHQNNETKLLGFIDSGNYDKSNSNSEYYFVEKSKLIKSEDLELLLKSSQFNEIENYVVNDADKASIIEFLEDSANNLDFIKRLLSSKNLREYTKNFEQFEITSTIIGQRKELFTDNVLDIIGAQQVTDKNAQEVIIEGVVNPYKDDIEEKDLTTIDFETLQDTETNSLNDLYTTETLNETEETAPTISTIEEMNLEKMEISDIPLTSSTVEEPEIPNLANFDFLDDFSTNTTSTTENFEEAHTPEEIIQLANEDLPKDYDAEVVDFDALEQNQDTNNESIDNIAQFEEEMANGEFEIPNDIGISEIENSPQFNSESAFDNESYNFTSDSISDINTENFEINLESSDSNNNEDEFILEPIELEDLNEHITEPLSENFDINEDALSAENSSIDDISDLLDNDNEINITNIDDIKDLLDSAETLTDAEIDDISDLLELDMEISTENEQQEDSQDITNSTSEEYSPDYNEQVDELYEEISDDYENYEDQRFQNSAPEVYEMPRKKSGFGKFLTVLTLLLSIGAGSYYMLKNNGFLENGIELPPMPIEGDKKVKPESTKTTPAKQEQKTPVAQAQAPSKNTVQSTQTVPKVNEKASTKVQEPIISDTVYSADISNISWEVPSDLAYNNAMNSYLIRVGKTLKLSLQSDLLVVTELPRSNVMQTTIILNNEGAITKAEIAKTSGSKEVDKVVLQSVKDTINYIKPPSSVLTSQNLTLGLIINF